MPKIKTTKQLRQAHVVSVFMCPDCEHLHVGLEDEAGTMFAHFVVPDEFLDMLMRAEEEAARQRVVN
jgi:hypothetical protein